MVYRLAESTADLEKILELQRPNLKQYLTEATKEEQGFLTLEHTLPILEKMHAVMPSLIAMDQDVLAGYALSLPMECMHLFPALNAMEALINTLHFNDKPLNLQRIYYMGQICVHESYRGKGIFKELYAAHAQHFSSQFDCMLTEVSTANKRSTAAHLNAGFKIIHQYQDESGEWQVIAWNWC